MMTLADSKDCWIDFKRTITVPELPERFTFPFYHEPHPLCIEAAAELQEYIQTQTEWEHNFGLDPAMPGLVIGKMFGVMLVQKSTGEVGYITAFSGKLADKNAHTRFVPPIFDMLAPDSFFLKGEEVISKVNEAIETLEQSAELKIARQQLEDKLAAADRRASAMPPVRAAAAVESSPTRNPPPAGHRSILQPVPCVVPMPVPPRHTRPSVEHSSFPHVL